MIGGITIPCSVVGLKSLNAVEVLLKVAMDEQVEPAEVAHGLSTPSPSTSNPRQPPPLVQPSDAVRSLSTQLRSRPRSDDDEYLDDDPE